MTIHWCEIFMLLPLALGVGILAASFWKHKRPPAAGSHDRRVASGENADKIAASIIQ